MRLFLAGAETPHAHNTLISVKAPFIMYSYYYLRRHKARRFLEEAHSIGAKIAIHPGTMSFRGKYDWYRVDPKNEDEVIITDPARCDEEDEVYNAIGNINAYGAKYLEFCEKHKDLIDTAFSFDPYGLVKSNQITSWYQQLQEIIPNAFFCSEDLNLGEVLNNAYGVAVPGKYKANEYQKVLGWRIRQTGAKLHIFGTSSTDVLKKKGIYSVDSTSWVMGGKYGAVFEYKHKTIARVIDTRTPSKDKERILRRLRKKITAAGIDYDSMVSGNGFALNHWNAIQWVEYAKHLNNAGNTPMEPKETTAIQKAEPKKTEVSTFVSDPRVTMMRMCDTCVINGSCPAYDPGASCDLDRATKVETTDDIHNIGKQLLAISADRILHAAMAEKLEGEVLNPDLTAAISAQMKNVTDFIKATTPKASLSIEAEGGGVDVFAALLSGVSGSDGKSSQTVSRRAAKQATKAAVEESRAETDAFDAEFIDINDDKN